MPEAACAHGRRGRLHAFFPHQPRLIGAAKTRTARQKVCSAARCKPIRLGNLLLPTRNGAACFREGMRERCGERRVQRTGHAASQEPRCQGQRRVGVDGNGVVERDGHNNRVVRFFRQRPLRCIRYTDDVYASLPRLTRQLHDFGALAAPRNHHHRGVLGKVREGQQFRGIVQVHRMGMLMKEDAQVQRGVPTAPDARQVDVPRPADRRRRRRQRSPPRAIWPGQKLDGPPQLLRLPQYVFQEMCHFRLTHIGLFHVHGSV